MTLGARAELEEELRAVAPSGVRGFSALGEAGAREQEWGRAWAGQLLGHAGVRL